MKLDSTLPIFDVSSMQPRRPEQAEHQDLIRAVRLINATDALDNNELTFSMDRETKRPIIKIVDRKTQEVVQQIPSEQVLRIAEHLRLLLEHRLL